MTEAKFLGVIFDRTLSYSSHVNYPKTNCLKALDILKVVDHTDWGADQETVLCLYRALVRSKLDYGCIAYGAASNNIPKKLDPIHHQGLWIAPGAFRSSPVASLYAKAHEMSLKSRRKKLSMNYVLKLNTCPDNPAYSCVFEPSNSKLFEKSSLTPPFGPRILPLFEDSKIDLDVVDDTTVSDTPPWSQSEPKISVFWQNLKKTLNKP